MWIRSQEVTTQAYTIMPVMAVSIMFNCASVPAYNVLIASGHTRLPLVANIIALPVMWIGCYFGIQMYGLMGAAVCGLTSNCLYFLVYEQYCRNNILRLKSFSLGSGFPLELLLPVGIIGFLSKAAMPVHVTPMLTILWLVSSMTLFYVLGLFFIRYDRADWIKLWYTDPNRY